jgi:serine/threonine-protein kinase
VQLVRAARIPSIIAINPNVEPALDAIVRKALARNRDDRYATAADMGDALSGYLFSQQMKATQKDVAMCVAEIRAAKAVRSSTKASLIDALIKDEINQLTSLVAEEMRAKPLEASEGEMIDTKGWASDLGDE